MIGRRQAESEHASVTTVYRNFFGDSVEVHLAVEIRFVELVILSYLEMWFYFNVTGQSGVGYAFCLHPVGRESRIYSSG